MSGHTEPTPREIALAKRIEALETQTSRPAIAGGGVVLAIVNAIVAVVPLWLVRTAVLVALAYYGWDYFNKAQQIAAETLRLEAEAATVAAQADAENRMIGDANLRARTMQAELAKARAERDQAQIESEAQKTRIDGLQLRLRTLMAELGRTQAEAQQAQAELDAQNQIVNGITPLAVAQKKAEVDALEAEANKKLQRAKMLVDVSRQNKGQTVSDILMGR